VSIEGSDSETSLRKLQKYSRNFLKDIKAKSDATLRKYDLMDSPKVEEVIEEESPDDLDHPEAALVPTTLSLLTTGTLPKTSEKSDKPPSIFSTLEKTADFTEEALARIRSKKKSVSSATTPEFEKEKKPAPSSSLVPFFDRAVEVTDGITALFGGAGSSSPDAPPPSTPEPSVSSDDPSLLFSPRKPKKPRTDLTSFIPIVRSGVELFDEFTSSPATPPPPKATSAGSRPLDDTRKEPRESKSPSSDAPIPGAPVFTKAPTLGERTTLLPPPETIAGAPKPADGAREEPKETPPVQPHWIRRAAVVTIIAGAVIVVGIRILNRFSLMPASVSKFSLPTNLEDSNAMKFLSSLAKFLFQLFKSSRVESAKGA
jgi:hypothetical protein